MPDNQPMLWTAPRRVESLFLVQWSSARRVALRLRSVRAAATRLPSARLDRARRRLTWAGRPATIKCRHRHLMRFEEAHYFAASGGVTGSAFQTLMSSK